MASLSTVTDGEKTKFIARLFHAGLTAEMLRKVNACADMAPLMIKALMCHQSFTLVHGRFAPLADKIAQVKFWPGINPAAVDAAVALAKENGTIAGYEAEVAGNPLLDIVITVYRESVPATLLYARDRMKDVYCDRYFQWNAAYTDNVDERRVKLIDGAKPFNPNKIVVEVVDLGANWNREGGVNVLGVQQAQAARLAGFTVLYAASQSPEWVRQMDGENVPYPLAAALRLNVPEYDGHAYMPVVCRRGVNTYLGGDRVDSRHPLAACPVLREY